MCRRLVFLVLFLCLMLPGITGIADASAWVAGVGEAQSEIAAQGLNYFGDSTMLQEVQTTNEDLYKSLETGAGVLFVGYQDTTARINSTITNQDAAIILSRYYGGNPQSGSSAITEIFGSSSGIDPTATFDASQLSSLVQGKVPAAGDGGSQWTMRVIDQANSYAPGTYLTRGEFLTLDFPPPVVPPPPPEEPGVVWEPPPPSDPVYYPPSDVRSFTAILEQPTVRPGNAFAVKATIVGQAANVLVTVPWGNYPMQRQGSEWRAYVPIPSSHAGGAYPVKASAVIQQPPDYLDWKPFQQEFTVMISNVSEPEVPQPSNYDDLPDWWTPPWIHDWYSG
ncbi:MAG: hypothetical protein ACYC2T_11410 [Bacillota bacterium]